MSGKNSEPIRSLNSVLTSICRSKRCMRSFWWSSLLGFATVHELLPLDTTRGVYVSDLISSCRILFINFTELNSLIAA